MASNCFIASFLLLLATCNNASALSAPGLSMRSPGSSNVESSAFSNNNNNNNNNNNQIEKKIIEEEDTATKATATTDITSSPWRVVLDIGREPLANMPFKWARSGCRMPLKIPCDMQSDNNIIPRSNTVSFTGPDGAVVRPIVGGKWELSGNDKKELSMSFTFPEYMCKNDVWIDAGTTFTLQSIIYTKDEIDRLNEEYYKARDEMWEVGSELNDLDKQRNGPKKWNVEKQKWESPSFGFDNILSQVSKQVNYFNAKIKQNQKQGQRPDLNDLSYGGNLPGINSSVYIQKHGTIKIGNVVAGRWYAEPIIN